MLNVAVLEELHLLRAADAASQREDAALSWVLVRGWVGNTERAIDAVAVMESHVFLIVIVVAALAHVMRAEAAKESDAAAELAFPVDLRGAMLFALSLTGANRLKKAFLAEKILLLGLLLLGVSHLLLTVDEATEVWLLAVVALVERTPVVRVFLRLPEVGIRFVAKTFVLKKALLLGVLERLFLNFLFHGEEWFELLHDFATRVLSDL